MGAAAAIIVTVGAAAVHVAADDVARQHTYTHTQQHLLLQAEMSFKLL